MSEQIAAVVIAGGGLSGFTVAQELRRHAFAGTITIVDPEGTAYDRPPLSKEYLDGRFPAEKLPFVPPAWFEENSVELIADRVTTVDADAHTVTLASGRALACDRVVLATGGQARRLPVPGGDLEGIFALRTRQDADDLRALLTPGKHLAIIGAGLIGAEVASTAVAAGAEVTLIDPVPVPAVLALGQTIATHLHGLHERHGVRTICAPTTAIERACERWVVTVDGGPDSGGTRVEADGVLVAIGIVPDVTLGRELGLDVDGGVLVDEHQRTSNPFVYAVGDGARHRLADGTLAPRHEHWESAMNAGKTAAASIAGVDLPVHPAPWMWSDRYGHHVESVGSMAAGQLTVREKDGAPWIAFMQDDDGRLLGAAAIDGGNAVRAVRRIIDRGIVVDSAKLADASIDLKKLAR